MGKTKVKVQKIKNENVRARVQKSFSIVIVMLGCAALVGIIALFAMTSKVLTDDTDQIMYYMNQFYFESAATILVSHREISVKQW